MADCKSCKDKKNAADIDGQYAADIVSAYAERNAKRFFIIWIITFVLLVGTNAWWVWRESQFTDESWTYEAEQDTDGGGSNTFVGGDYFGTPEGQSNENNQNP